MPKYEYECPLCGHTIIVSRAYDEYREEICGQCQTVMEYVYSPATIIFKGGGWTTLGGENED